jgi:hypothetical protein
VPVHFQILNKLKGLLKRVAKQYPDLAVPIRDELRKVPCLGLGVYGFGFRVSGFGMRVSGVEPLGLGLGDSLVAD